MLSYEAWMDGRTAVCHNKSVFWRAYKNEWPISWNYEYIIFGQIIFQNFHQFKAFVGLSDCRIIATAPVRNPRFFTPPQCRTKSYKDSFFPTVLDLWNKLDNDTRNIQSLSSFKIKLNEDVDKSPSFYSSVFSSTVRIGEPFNNISKFKASWNFLRELKSCILCLMNNGQT
jgi:hypothetical protein